VPRHASVARLCALVRERGLLRRAVPVLVLVALLVAVQSQDPMFLTAGSLQALAGSAAPIILLASGLTLVILLGGFDLSVAAMATLASVLLALWLPALGWLGLGLVLASGAAFGALQGLVHGATQIPSFVVTLGGLGLLTGLALKLSDASTQAIDDRHGILLALTDRPLGVPNAFLVALAVVAGVGLVLYATRLGRAVFAIGAAEPAALLSGVRTVRVRVIVFALSALLAALAGVLLSAETSFASPTLASDLLLPTVAAVVVGGTAISGGVGGLWAAVVGALIVTSVRVGTEVTGLDPAVQQIAFGATIVAAVALTTDRRKIGVIK